MTNSKSTKRAFVTSALAILMCIAMLVGTTFAWFTDTASTSVNKIQAGKLDIELQMKDSTGNWVNAEGTTLNFKKAAGHEAEEILWEPGCTYELPELRVINNGNLALKYKIVVSGINGDAKLLEAITFTGATGTTEGKLLPGAASDSISLVGTMKKEAGNEYQGLSAEGISVTVYATQDTVEYDSNGNTYDADATYPVASAAELTTALTNGGIVSVANSTNVSIAPAIADSTASTLYPQSVIRNDTVLKLDGKITINPEGVEFGRATPVIASVESGTLTIDGDGELNCEAGENQVYGINVMGGKVVINGGNYYGAITAIQVQKGSLEINGGFFDMAPTCKAQVPQYSKYVINCIDSAFKSGNATISVKGGTFVNFDPSANPEGAGTTYVADGYKVVSQAQSNGDTWYTVVAK